MIRQVGDERDRDSHGSSKNLMAGGGVVWVEVDLLSLGALVMQQLEGAFRLPLGGNLYLLSFSFKFGEGERR